MEAEYITHVGDDLLVVNSARVSFDKESTWEYDRVDIELAKDFHHDAVVRRLGEKDKKLIKYLAKHGHWTPFSHPQITLKEAVPIFVARQRFKHMVGFTYNEVSRRYVDYEPEFYVPDVWRARPEGSVKQGSDSTSMNSLRVMTSIGYAGLHEAYTLAINACERLYKQMIEGGVAPEQARMVLPQSMYTEYYVTGSLAAFARAYNQRIDNHAQKEIQDLAKQWNEIIRPLFPESWEALTK